MKKSERERYWLELANEVANATSGCSKVKVGSVIVKAGMLISIGSNSVYGNLCKKQGCLRIELYGDDTKAHRNPGDCRAIHSEIQAITTAITKTQGSTIYVTRYPCENCALAIVSAGISKVVYGRDQNISAMTQEIFDMAGVTVVHNKLFNEEDVLV